MSVPAKKKGRGKLVEPPARLRSVVQQRRRGLCILCLLFGMMNATALPSAAAAGAEHMLAVARLTAASLNLDFWLASET